MAERLRDLSKPIDVPLLDATVAAFYGTGSKEEVGFSPRPRRSLWFCYFRFWSSRAYLGVWVRVCCCWVGVWWPLGFSRVLDGCGV